MLTGLFRYVNTCRRKVNEGFDAVVAGAVGQPDEQQHDPGLRSEPASARSSMDSQKSSSGGRRLLKKRADKS